MREFRSTWLKITKYVIIYIYIFTDTSLQKKNTKLKCKEYYVTEPRTP